MVTMNTDELDGGGIMIPFPDPGIAFSPCPGNLKCGAGSQQDILDAMDDKCCTLYLYGHRGGKRHEGGIITYIPGPKRIDILPDDPGQAFEERLKKKFSENCCKDCVINLVTCGGDDLALGRQNRRKIAANTGCIVCGTVGLKHNELPVRIVLPNPYPDVGAPGSMNA